MTSPNKANISRVFANRYYIPTNFDAIKNIYLVNGKYDGKLFIETNNSIEECGCYSIVDFKQIVNGVFLNRLLMKKIW